ncbi:hypothetical protein FFLO_02796 [Filobasidium floriforme]|uniref:Yeast cell wall synthesis Kre9/Knh1-like N-terminal domain-containing protein n=1 Tax=Filobasidium floriforme TaxID=5210 RepID=A0A8K0JNE6_9TREE|nr:hypothetical protein FFLO_02796 [Filobasidium floriforme]
MFALLSTLTLALLGSAAAQFTITSPTSEIFWISDSDNVVSWTGTSPAAQFTVFIANPNVNLLTDRTPIVAILDAFRGSYLLNPGALPAGTGYTIQLTDTLNSTNIYAESEAFELKPAGSAYPTVTPAGAADPATATQSGSMGTATSTGTQSSAAASSAPANGAETMGLAWSKVGGVVGLGVVGALLV